MARRFPLHIHISTLFIVLTLLIGGITGWLGYRAASQILTSTTAQLNARIGAETENKFAAVLGSTEMATRMISYGALPAAATLDERLAGVGLMREALQNSEAMSSIYIGYDNGDFLMLRRLWDAADRQRFGASENTAYLVQSIDHAEGEPRGTYLFYDADLALLKRQPQPDYANNYDPRTRDWYKLAMVADGQVKTPPYIFHTTGRIGFTVANRATRSAAVVGADIRLETVDRSLASQKVTPGTQIVVATREGLTLSYEDPGKAVRPPKEPGGPLVLATVGDLSPVFGALAPALQAIDSKTPISRSLTVDGELWHTSIYPLEVEGARRQLFAITAIPDKELMAAANDLLQRSVFAVAIIILLAIPVTWLLARAISGPLRKLAGEAESIRHFEFTRPISARSIVLEVDELAATMDSMKRTIHRFLDISQSAAAEKNFERLLPRLLGNTLSAAEAAAGVLYLADNDELKPVAALFADGSPLPGSPASLAVSTAGPLLTSALASGHASYGVLSDGISGMLGLSEALQACGATHGIALPLRNREDKLVGGMLLLGGENTDDARLSFIEALSGSLAVSLEAKELIHAQKRLFEAMIQLIAGAIDAKSPYTGGHCARVPELTKMLARAACAASDGPFKDFSLNDEGWEAVHVAAWLHDCGKVTTPEYVVDKATKLETLYDRIHEVRMRFEVLKRDAEIACLQAIAGGAPEADARARLAGELQQLDDDFAFIAECNEGGEFMAPEKLDRLAAIAARTWQRTLDDRIGISHEEKERKARTPPATLPATEPLLADRPEHRIERRPQDRMPPDNKWGFRMPVPDLLYNRGELYNLAVARGTLSDEERYKIQEHIVQTLIMLGQLPFPKHLREVPEIAGGHHEKMDGTGYPRRLAREDMSPVARMMAIADIFEALTAVDRPYKKGKMLSEAIRIMSFMKKDRHIDPELFDLFLRAGIYRDYAERFMKPEQIDSVDVAAYLEPAATT